jgi:DNA primase
MNRQAIDELKQQIPLLDYLEAHDWRPVRRLSRSGWMGLCPLHNDHKPSFLVDPGKSLFYCYGCGRGGDVIRFAELYHQVKFPQALTLLLVMNNLGVQIIWCANFKDQQDIIRKLRDADVPDFDRKPASFRRPRVSTRTSVKRAS